MNVRKLAREMALAHGYIWDDIEQGVKKYWLKRAGEATESNVCPKCSDQGFTEEEHGIFRVTCDCEKGKALMLEMAGEIPDEEVRVPTKEQMELIQEKKITLDYEAKEKEEKYIKEASELAHKALKERQNDSDSVTFAIDDDAEGIEWEPAFGESGIAPPDAEEVKDDSDSGTGQDNKLTGSGDTGELPKPKKRKAKKKAGKRAS